MNARAPWLDWQPRSGSIVPEAHFTRGLIEASPPAWRWAVALGLGAAVLAVTLKIAPHLAVKP